VPCQRLFPLSHDCVSQLSGWDGKSESPKVRNGYSRVRFYARTLLFLRVNVLGSRGEPIHAALDTRPGRTDPLIAPIGGNVN
jgi:hypothetical protein